MMTAKVLAEMIWHHDYTFIWFWDSSKRLIGL